MRVRIDGGEFTGAPGEIVGAMREKAWEQGKTVEEYMQRVAKRIWRFGGESLIIKEDTEEERCRDFIRQLSGLGIAQVEESAQ